jgi:hypothetical protein
MRIQLALVTFLINGAITSPAELQKVANLRLHAVALKRLARSTLTLMFDSCDLFLSALSQFHKIDIACPR